MVIQPPFKDSFNKGRTRSILLPTISNLREEPKESKISILSTPVNSQERTLKAKGIEVKAPTGQISIILPESSSLKKAER